MPFNRSFTDIEIDVQYLCSWEGVLATVLYPLTHNDPINLYEKTKRLVADID